MLAEPITIDRDGRVAVPERPGFGFVLDHERIARHTVHVIERGTVRLPPGRSLMRIKAAVLPAPGARFEVAELELAPAGPGEVLVKIVASGLCGSDLHAVDGDRTLVPFPAVLGHEAGGVVVETGPGVTRLRPGDHVVLSIVPSCGGCPMCRRGRPNYCAVASGGDERRHPARRHRPAAPRRQARAPLPRRVLLRRVRGGPGVRAWSPCPTGSRWTGPR